MPLLRLACSDDAPALAVLKLVTFRQTFLDDGFGIPYPPADLAAFEAENYSEASVAAELADPARRSWVVEDEGQLIGYAQVGPCKLPHPQASPDDGELYQLYVRREAQGLKLGKKLLELSIDYLVATRPGPIRLGVWSGNEKAQAVYYAMGFEKIGDYRFRVGSWYDEEYIFRKG